jgi:cyanate permease
LPTDIEATGRSGRSKWTIEAALLLVQFGMGLSFLAVAPLFPLIIEDYGISRASASLVVGATSLVVALALVPASALPARLGTRGAVLVGGVLMSAMALSPLALVFPAMLAIRLLFALGGAVLLSALPAVIVRWFEPRELALVNGLGIIAQTLGVAASMSFGARVAGFIGWQGTLGAFGAVTCVATAGWFIVSAGTPRDGGGAASLSLGDMRAVAFDRITVLLGLGFAGALGANISLASWLPTFYQEQFGFSLERAGAIASILTLFGMVGSLLGSVLPLRIPRRRPFLIGAGLVLPVAAFGCFTTSSSIVLLPSLALFGVSTAIFIPVMLTIPMEVARIGGARSAVAVAVILGAGNLSGFVLPLAIGALRDGTGSFTLGLGVAAVLALALAGAGVLVPETGPGSVRSEVAAEPV